ncbi:MAG TPA: uroporphyrinogen-III C-methyltransferase [Burkholderiales bacterium]|nr:uroporphyrinogen-III C-methyltransferase [Burkholderiales bacterium]
MSDAPQPAVRAARGMAEGWLRPAVAVLAIVVVALAWAWWDARADLAAVREEVAQRLREAANESKEARVVAREAQEAVRDAQGKIGALEGKQLESQSQQLALESLYQELSRSRDEWVLAEVEQTLAIAAQQLQLAGNVRAALAALQTADARLARSDRPQFLGLRKVIARDIERLKAAPDLDVAGMTLRIDQVIAAVDQMPLLADGRPPVADAKQAPQAAEASWWQRSWRRVWEEFKGLVRVQRLDAADSSLLAPESRYFLRENLKLRLLHARLALLQRDEPAFRSDIKAALGWLSRYFDTRQKTVAIAAQTLAQLNVASVNVELPSIADSLNAVRTFKMPRERAVK